MTAAGMRGFLISSSLDHSARVFDLVTGRTLYNLVTVCGVTCVASNSLGSQVYLGHIDGTVKVVSLLPAPNHGDVEVSNKVYCLTKIELFSAFMDLKKQMIVWCREAL